MPDVVVTDKFIYKSDGQLAYEGYVKAAHSRSLISGAELPIWQEQADVIKEAWEAAAEAVMGKLIRE